VREGPPGTRQHTGENYVDIMQHIWEWAKGKITTQEINNKCLIATDHKVRTVWHVAANCNNLFLREFIEWAKNLRITEEIYNKFLLARDC
jgi:hypothetical protein